MFFLSLSRPPRLRVRVLPERLLSGFSVRCLGAISAICASFASGLSPALRDELRVLSRFSGFSDVTALSGLPVGLAGFSTRVISFWISFSTASKCFSSRGVQMVNALPSRPARPVRPMRCT